MANTVNYTKPSQVSTNYQRSIQTTDVLLLEDGGELLLEDNNSLLLDFLVTRIVDYVKTTVNSTDYTKPS